MALRSLTERAFLKSVPDSAENRNKQLKLTMAHFIGHVKEIYVGPVAKIDFVKNL